jgi:hypothetical protein
MVATGGKHILKCTHKTGNVPSYGVGLGAKRWVDMSALQL